MVFLSFIYFIKNNLTYNYQIMYNTLLIIWIYLMLPFEIFYFYSKALELWRIIFFIILSIFISFISPILLSFLFSALLWEPQIVWFLAWFLITSCYVLYSIWLMILSLTIICLKKKNHSINKKLFIRLSILLPILLLILFSYLFLK